MFAYNFCIIIFYFVWLQICILLCCFSFSFSISHSLTGLGLSLALHPHFPTGYGDGLFFLPPVYSQSLCHQNFLLIASTLGPGGWILSQVLNWVNYGLDSGVNTCGLEFDYDMPEDDEQIDEKQEEDGQENKEEGNGPKEKSTIQHDILDFLYKSDVTFKSETGIRCVDELPYLSSVQLCG